MGVRGAAGAVPLGHHVLLVNSFVAQAAELLVQFGARCEERLGAVGEQLARTETLLALLEAKLRSVPEGEGDAPPPLPSLASSTAPAAPAATTPRPALDSAAPGVAPRVAPVGAPGGLASGEAAHVTGLGGAGQPASSGASVSVAATPPEELAKYVKLLRMGMPQEHVMLKMQSEGVDPSRLDAFVGCGTEATPPATASRAAPERTVAAEPEAAAVSAPPPEVDAAYAKYRAMLKMGVPGGGVRSKMLMDGLDPAVLFTSGTTT
jgi:hypothetical protein